MGVARRDLDGVPDARDGLWGAGAGHRRAFVAAARRGGLDAELTAVVGAPAPHRARLGDRAGVTCSRRERHHPFDARHDDGRAARQRRAVAELPARVAAPAAHRAVDAPYAGVRPARAHRDRAREADDLKGRTVARDGAGLAVGEAFGAQVAGLVAELTLVVAAPAPDGLVAQRRAAEAGAEGHRVDAAATPEAVAAGGRGGVVRGRRRLRASAERQHEPHHRQPPVRAPHQHGG